MNPTKDSMEQFRAEVIAAGIAADMVGLDPDGNVVLFDKDGQPVVDDRLQDVIDAHVPNPLPEEPDWGSDEPSDNFRQQAADVVRQFRYYLSRGVGGNPNPTAVENVAAIKLIIRVLLFMIRYVVMPPRLDPPLPPVLPDPLVLAGLTGEQSLMPQPTEEEIAAMLEEHSRRQIAQAEAQAEMGLSLRVISMAREMAKEQGVSDERLAATIAGLASSFTETAPSAPVELPTSSETPQEA